MPHNEVLKKNRSKNYKFQYQWSELRQISWGGGIEKDFMKPETNCRNCNNVHCQKQSRPTKIGYDKSTMYTFSSVNFTYLYLNPSKDCNRRDI